MMEICVPFIGFSPRPKITTRSISLWLPETKENGDCFKRIESSVTDVCNFFFVFVLRSIDQEARSRINLSLCQTKTPRFLLKSLDGKINRHAQG
ncbi:hypothetical protein HID58_012869 [Brassica napus]|uniref:Uncharacterized protein n=1 Tax=Brassica napus TaxID=3708 RepID=A0ABQ8E2W8_BRANA|nr:hypothetical protein HID58_012869 [Brassica napus]